MKNPAEKLHVLVVDDTADSAQSMGAFLQLAGIMATMAPREEALRIAAELRPEVVLLDTPSPSGNGLEILKRLRAQPATAKIPVILLVAAGRQDLLEQIRAAGADDYWIKDRIELHNIAELVESVYRRHTRGASSFQDDPQPRPVQREEP